MTSARQAISEPENGISEMLARFRSCHRYSTTVVKIVKWLYIACGQGKEAILLLPGGPGRAEIAFEYILAFEERYRVIAPDYPAPPGMVEEMLDGLVAILEAEGIERAHVVGGSYSGLIAQRFVRRHPERVASLVLSDTGAPSPARARKYAGYLRILQAFPLRAIHALWRMGAYLYLREVREERTFWRAYFREMIATITRQECVGRLKVWIDFDRNSRFTPADLTGWPGSILILHAEHDTTFPAEEQAALRRLYPQARVRTFRDGGHAAPVTYRKEYIAAISDFIRAAPPNEAAS
jgi:pimeloyl-ACP methyl ester carboxylesterase